MVRFLRQHALCAPIVMPAHAGIQEVGVKTRQDALDSRVKPGNDKLEWGFLVVLSSIQYPVSSIRPLPMTTDHGNAD